ncbi:MAG: HAD-IIIA family hydrolase [Bacilli bacterium]
MITVIMAGGKGTRISSIASDIPKPMIPINGKPVLEHEIECLKSQGLKDIIITVSHLGQTIIDYFGDGAKFGVNIDYYFEKEPLGNAGALFKIKEKLSDTFLLLNADAIFDIDFNRFIKYHFEKGALATLFTHPNSHPYDSGLIITDKENKVVKWLTKEDDRPEWYKNRVNAGLHVIDKKILDVDINTPKIDLDRQILKPLSGTGKMFAYDSPEYVKDMGTPERYYKVIEDFTNGVVKSRNLSNKQKAIFLDRDGTLNKYVGFLTNIDDLQLLEGTSKAIKKINESKYLAIVITNQPVVARGEVTFDELNEIHNKLETLLGKEGAYLDAIYYCPHHPHSGYEGEVKELKFDCECRKPKPGLILQAAKDFNIDLSNSFMIGDSESDVLCGNNAGCKSILIDERKSLLDIIEEIL